ncbi:MAG: BamA/TamA family outer membrane protein, partial [Terriglobia bacterium]
QRTAQFGFTEPYLFDRPISTGFTLFTSKYNFNQAEQEALLTGQQVSVNPQYIQNYNQDSTGFTAFASYPMKRFSFAKVGLTYGLTRTNITAFNQASSLLFEQLQFRSIAGPSALNGIISSSISPSISYNTIDNPMNETKGKSVYYALTFQGGPLGGNVNTITNIVDFKYFHPTYHHRNAIGVHFSTAYITGYGGKEVPPFSRFYMGGEQDLRGFDIRSISPVVFIPTVTTQLLYYHDPLSAGALRSFNLPVLVYSATLPGGDTQTYGNFEYRIPIVGNYASMSFFVDSGTDGILDGKALHLDPTGIANIQQTFPDAPLAKTLEIYHGTNFRLRNSAGIEFGINIPIIQAPFRIYYAYNLNRLYQQIVAPNPFVNQTTLDMWRTTLDKEVPNLWETEIAPQLSFLNNPGRLNYFEPKTTFRFTVGKTF